MNRDGVVAAGSKGFPPTSRTARRGAVPRPRQSSSYALELVAPPELETGDEHAVGPTWRAQPATSARCVPGGVNSGTLPASTTTSNTRPRSSVVEVVLDASRCSGAVRRGRWRASTGRRRRRRRRRRGARARSRPARSRTPRRGPTSATGSAASHERDLAVHVDAARRRARRSAVGSRHPAIASWRRVSRTASAAPRILGRCPACGWPPPRSTPSSAISTATRTRILEAYDAAEAAGCDLVVFPELTVTGYPPEDLLLRPAFVAAGGRDARQDRGAHRRVRGGDRLPRAGPTTSTTRRRCARTAQVLGVYRKQLLPNYAVFDEQRYFVAVDRAAARCSTSRACKVGVSICEDAWSPTARSSTMAAGGAELVVNLNASPYYAGRLARARDDARDPRRRRGGPDRLRRTSSAARTSSCSTARRSCSTSRASSSPARSSSTRTCSSSTSTCAAFRKRSSTRAVDVDAARVAVDAPRRAGTASSRCSAVHEVYEALVLGTRDYVRKNGFTDVLIGLSGGIDSVARRRDRGRRARRRARHRRADAVALLERAQRRRRRRARREPRRSARYTVPIEPAHAAFEAMLAPVFAGTAPGRRRGERAGAHPRQRADDDLEQVRLDGAHDCGNKSEMATGYATLYGDMAGGFAVIKDVPKTLVYALCRDLNERAGSRRHPAGRASTSRRRPSCDPTRRTPTRCPTYDVLDPIIEGYVEDDLSVARARSRAASTPSSCAASRAWSIATSTSAARRAPGVRVSPQGVRQGPPPRRSPTAGPAERSIGT